MYNRNWGKWEMKSKTYLALMEELKNNEYGLYGKYCISRLFKVYTDNEINCFEDFYKLRHKDFTDFVKMHMNLFTGKGTGNDDHMCKDDEKMLNQIAFSTVAKLNIIAGKYFDYYRQEQGKFVDLVEHIIGKSNALEVGSGSIPYTSIMLAQKLGHIHSMDKFALSDECLSKLNVAAHNQYFDESTSVKPYEIVVGKKPCSAIPHIVTNCSVQKTPYFLELCGCDAPKGEVDNWKPILQSFDPSIKFKKATVNTEYAYNLDM